MPRKSREDYNEYMRHYMLRRYHQRRTKMLELLGGKCEDCGSAELLEIDHRDPVKKAIDISKLWNLKWETVLNELEKCQLLCKKCHDFKSVDDRGHMHSEGNHGTLTVYRQGCRCDRCQNAQNINNLK